MSLWSHDRLRIVLAPEQVALLHSGKRLTMRGYEHHVHAHSTVPCEPAGEDGRPWGGALSTLATALPAFTKGGMSAEVVLSNHFVQYTLVPWQDQLSDEEELVFARHCFHEVYGSVADGWSVRVSPGRAGTAALASAVDSGLLDELRALMEQTGLQLASIQPHLMTACNSCRASLDGHSAWVALLEPGNLCLALLQQGRLVWIRKLRIGEAWEEELPMLLERERLLADATETLDEVLLWAPHLEAEELMPLGRWKVWQLKPGTEPVQGGLHDMVTEA